MTSTVFVFDRSQWHHVRSAGVPQVSQTQGRAAGDHSRNRRDRREVRQGPGHRHRGVLPAHDGGRSAERRPTDHRVPKRVRAEGAQRRPVAKAARRIRDSRRTGRRRPAHSKHRPAVPGSVAFHATRVPVVLHPPGTYVMIIYAINLTYVLFDTAFDIVS